MSFLRFSVASELIEKRKGNLILGCFDCSKEKSPTSVEWDCWRSCRNNKVVLGRRKFIGRHAPRCIGVLYGNRERRLVDVSCGDDFGRRNVMPFNKLGDVSCFILRGTGGMHSAVELVEESESDEFDETAIGEISAVQEDIVSHFVEDKTVNFVDDATKRHRRKLTTSRLMGSKTKARRTVSWPVSVKNNRTKYIRKGSDDLEVILSSVGHETCVERCNAILKLLEQSNEEKTLAFFDWMKINGKLNQNAMAYNLALRALGRMEDWNLAELLLDEMVSKSNCQLNFQVFNSLIFVCAKRGKPKKGAKWFRLMLDRRIQPNVATFGMLMGLYQKTGNLPEAEFTFDQMRRCKVYCIAAYSALITLYTRLGLYGKSEEIIGLVEEDKVSPNMDNFLVQLNTYCQQGKLEEAESVFKRMQESGVPANIVAYNTLITGYGKAANTKAAQKVFRELLSVGLEPDETTYRSMIESYGRAKDYRQVKLYYTELKLSGFHPNSSNFYTMINLQARHGDESETIQTLFEMRTAGCEYSSVLSALLHAYERVGRVHRVPLVLEGSFYEDVLLDPTSCSILLLAYVKNTLLDEALRVLKNMRWKDTVFQDNLYHTLICYCKEACNHEAAIMIFDQMPKSKENPNLHITCSMIDIYSCMGRFVDAEDLYFMLRASGTSLDMIAYSIVVRMYVKSGSLEDACIVLDMIEKEKDIVPDIFLYRDMLRIYQQCSMLEKLANTYYKILKSKLEWDEAMYNCVINCCGRALPVDEISKLFDDMTQRGFAANSFTFNIMLDVYGKSGFLMKAEKVFQMARKQGLADIISYNTLIAAYGLHKDLGRMRYVVQQMQTAGYQVSLEAYNCLLDAFGKEDQLEEFNDILKKMKQSRCASDHYTYNIMINIYGKKGWIEDVAAVLAELRNHGMEPDLYSYNTLIKAYGIAGMVEEAVNVVKEIREKRLQPDRVTYVNLITALQRNENYLEAVKWSLWMKQVELSG